VPCQLVEPILCALGHRRCIADPLRQGFDLRCLGGQRA
jgi:hypothetical protein